MKAAVLLLPCVEEPAFFNTTYTTPLRKPSSSHVWGKALASQSFTNQLETTQKLRVSPNLSNLGERSISLMLIVSNCFLEKVWYCGNHDDVSSLARMIFCEGFSSDHWHSCPPPNETMACRRRERERPLRLLSFYIWKREVIHGQGTNISETYSFLQISQKQFCRRLTQTDQFYLWHKVQNHHFPLCVDVKL